MKTRSKKSSLGKREATRQLQRTQKKRPAKKNQLAVQQQANGLAKRSAKPGRAAASNGTSLVRTVKVPSKIVPAVDPYDAAKLTIGESEYPCDFDWISEEMEGFMPPKPIPAGKYVACLVSFGAFFAEDGKRGFRLYFLNLDGPHKGSYFSMDLWMATPQEIERTLKVMGELGLLPEGGYQEFPTMDEMDGVEITVKDGVVCFCDVTICRTEDGHEYNEVLSFDVLRIERPFEDAA